MIDCHGVMKRLWEYVDGELDPEEARAIAEHLSMCARCHPQYEFQLAFLASIVEAHGRRPAPRPEFASRLRAALAEVDPAALS